METTTGTKALDKKSAEARELARIPVGKTWVNADAVEEARRWALGGSE